MNTKTESTEEIEIQVIEQELSDKFEVIKSQAGDITIQDEKTLTLAEELMQVLKSEIKEVDTILGEAKDDLFKVYKKGMDRYNNQFKPRKALKDELSRKCAAYRRKLENDALIETNRLRKIEQDKADELKLQQATELEEQGRPEEAESVLNMPSTVAPIPVYTPKKTEGVSYRDNWKMKIINVDMIPREYLIPNDTLLNSVGKMYKGKKVVPGVEFYNEPISVTR